LGIDTITSTSANSISNVIIQFEASQDLNDSIRKVRDAVNNALGDLPEDANEPLVREISLDDTPIFSVALSGPYDGFRLYDYADDIKNDLEKIPDVREVTISGGDQAPN